MPEINKIPYEDVQDLDKFLYDNYYSSENLEINLTGTGFSEVKQFQLLQETGITENSTCKINYNNIAFNPLYAEAVWKCYMDSMEDCFVFFGLKETVGAPTFNMAESHAGFMIEDGKLYVSVADGDEQQRIEIVGIDLTRVQNFKIEYNSFFIQALPQVQSELGVPGVLTTFPLIVRKWAKVGQLSNYPPSNKNHNIVQFIKNSVNENKRIYFNRFLTKQVYAD